MFRVYILDLKCYRPREKTTLPNVRSMGKFCVAWLYAHKIDHGRFLRERCVVVYKNAMRKSASFTKLKHCKANQNYSVKGNVLNSF